MKQDIADTAPPTNSAAQRTNEADDRAVDELTRAVDAVDVVDASPALLLRVLSDDVESSAGNDPRRWRRGAGRGEVNLTLGR